MDEFTSSLKKFEDALEVLSSRKLKPGIYDYNSSKDSYHLSLVEASFRKLKESSRKIDCSEPQKFLKLMDALENHHKKKDVLRIKESVDALRKLYANSNIPVKETLNFSLRKIPPDIEADIKSDLAELEKCFSSNCLRSSIILCGRMLETALHRKYFEVTGQDILEKNPGIGLGTLVAKLSEKKVILDPAVLQQIHLLNQVRIFTVHKKKESFSPTRQQTHAMILYTLDIVQKLFV